MALSSVFGGAKIKGFAKELVETLSKRYPPALDINPEKRVSEARLARVLEEALTKAADFQRENSLGLVGKARLGSEFKWHLSELGYSEKFIDVALEGLMVYITRGSTPAKPTENKKG